MWDWDSIRQTSDGYCSVYDLLRVVDGAKNPREEWRRLTQKFPWLAERLDIRYMQFVGEGERPTPVIDTEGLHLLQGLMMRQHRARAAQHLESALKCLATLMQSGVENRGQTRIFLAHLLFSMPWLCRVTRWFLVLRFAMPRLPRYPLVDVPQHVIQRGHNRQPVFFHQDDYRVYLHCLHAAATVYACAIHAYVLMTNHVHLLLTPHRADSLAKVMQSLGRRYVQYINTTYQRTGTLWEGRYRASVVEADTYLLACSRYIELNPVRARMVPQPAAYPWSSYHWHALGHPDLVVTDHALYRRLGGTPQERQQAYQALFQGQLSAGLVQEIRTTLQQGRVLGTDRFKDAIETVLARRVRPGKAGRPRTSAHPKTHLAASEALCRGGT